MNDIYKAPQSAIDSQSERPGVIFLFDTEKFSISAEGGLANGAEKVYLNGKLVSEKRTYSRKSEHLIETDHGICKIIFSIKNPFSNKIFCQFEYQDDIRALCCEIKPKKAALIIMFSIIIILFFTLGALKTYFRISDNIDYFVYLLIFVVCVVFGIFTARNADKIVQEVEPNK